MQIIIDVILPVFGLVALGYGATFTRAFDSNAARGLSAFVFHFALPVALFRTMATTAIPEAAPFAFSAAYYLGTALMFLPALLLAQGGGDRRTLIGFGCAYSNTVLLGIPLVVTALGREASVPLLLLISFHSAIFFTLVTVLVEVSRGSTQQLRTLPGNLARGLVSNVILMAVVGGFLFDARGLAIPAPLDKCAEFLGRAAFPGALFSMGASLRSYRITGALRPALWIVAAKLIGHPVVVAVLVLFVFDVPKLWAQTAILSAALPVGINVYLFAVRYGVAEAETTTSILLSNVISVATIAIVLRLMGVEVPPGAGGGH